ncbi:hypothetical protein Pelo_6035 [Pelomyxa schiedti]|nr:hypothetical protein Pelo_6035 [Pelomyxa schiedti]
MMAQPIGLVNYGMTCYLNSALQAIKCLLNFAENRRGGITESLLRSFLMEGCSGEPLLRHLSSRSENVLNSAGSALKFLLLLVNTLVDEGSSVINKFLIHNMSESLSCPSECFQKEGTVKFNESIPKFHVLVTVPGISLQDSVDKSLNSAPTLRACSNCGSNLRAILNMELGEGLILASSDPSKISLHPDDHLSLHLFGQEYQLISIVGYAAGHYTSLCKSRSQWFFFNDTSVNQEYCDPIKFCSQWDPVLLVMIKSGDTDSKTSPPDNGTAEPHSIGEEPSQQSVTCQCCFGLGPIDQMINHNGVFYHSSCLS